MQEWDSQVGIITGLLFLLRSVKVKVSFYSLISSRRLLNRLYMKPVQVIYLHRGMSPHTALITTDQVAIDTPAGGERHNCVHILPVDVFHKGYLLVASHMPYYYTTEDYRFKAPLPSMINIHQRLD